MNSTHRSRHGQALVEFAMIALVLYMLLAAILTFGHMLYVAQGLQSAADLAAREISRTPLPADISLEDALSHNLVRERIYNPDYLVFDLSTLEPDEDFFSHVVGNWPLLNQQLATLMIVENLPDRTLIRYPGALLTDLDSPTGFTVGIPLVIARDDTGIESIRWVPVVQEIEPNDSDHSPFSVLNEETRGIVALRINYPFQSAAMSSFRPNPAGPFEPTIGSPNVADDGLVIDEINSPNGLIDSPLISGDRYVGTYGGKYGLGAQGALGSAELTGGRPVRPYRRVITGQAIYRREIFGP